MRYAILLLAVFATACLAKGPPTAPTCQTDTLSVASKADSTYFVAVTVCR